MTIAVVLLVALVAAGRGGYAPWATFALEVGAAGLVLVTVVRWLGFADGARHARHLLWRKLSFSSRHPALARVLRVASLGRWRGARATAGVEIVLPHRDGAEGVHIDAARELLVLGCPLKRTGLGVPLVLMTLWMLLSIVPMSRTLLSRISPMGASLRSEAERLVGLEHPILAPWSLVPFLTARSLWIWVAVLALFGLTVSLARRERTVRRLSVSLLVLGLASGLAGVAGWILELQAAHGAAGEALRARGTFGNPNHYAAFQAMLLLVGLGWLAHVRARAVELRNVQGGRRGRGARDEQALAVIAGLGLLVCGLGLVLSLSRAGLASCLAGAVAFAFLAREPGGAAASGMAHARRRVTRRAYAVLATALLGFTIWSGMDPLVGRFTELGRAGEVDGSRLELWRDTLPAVGDFWLTGSGLSSFRYVSARYRAFGGRSYYSWAHNDYLQLVIELGLPGLGLLVWLVALFVTGAKRVRDELAASPSMRLLHAGYLAAIVAVALHSATDFGLHLPANLALLAVLAGVAVGMETPQGTRGGSPPSRRRSRTPPLRPSPPLRR